MMEGLLITLVGGAIVGIFILALEYGYFLPRRKEKEKREEKRTYLQKPENELNISLPVKDYTVENPLPWPEAIQKAFTSFQNFHPGKQLEIKKTDAGTITAKLLVLAVSSDYTTTLVSTELIREAQEFNTASGKSRGRHDYLFRYASGLVMSHGHEQVLARAQARNIARCVPPLSYDDVIEQVESAERYRGKQNKIAA